MLELVFGLASDPGKVRANNEDATGCFVPGSRHEARSRGYLFAVADGVGGSDRGEVAAATAIAVLTREFAECQEGTLLTALLPRLLQHANSAVHDCRLQPEYRGSGMATTLVACALRYNEAVVSHLGDSRCYLVRNGQLRHLTRDHKPAGWRRLGLRTAGDGPEPATQHALTKCLGPELFVKPDTASTTLLAGDVLVLCTDGLHDEMPENEIVEIVSQKRKHADVVAEELVARAVARDGRDNTTAQVIQVRSVEVAASYRGRQYPASA
ncbi:MAG: PP2C family protein-serine/threonine phosphatase [Acidobacteriota bacterium]